MVSLAIIVTAAIGKSMASVNTVKTRRVAPMTAKVKSLISKLVSGHKPGVVSEIHTSLIGEIKEELQWLTDSDKASDDSHTSASPSSDTHSEESALVGCDELKILPSSIIDVIVKSNKTANCLPVKLEVDGKTVKDLVYSQEAFTVSELELFEIKLVPAVVLPELDFYAAAEGLVPLAGYKALLAYQ